MPCYKPIKAWHRPGGGITFNSTQGYSDRPAKVPCGKCIGCRLEHSRQWAVRMVHEASLHRDNCFITLTFSNDGLARRWVEDGTHPSSLNVRDWQLFAKRLRKEIEPRAWTVDRSGHVQPQRLRFFHCGEYGSKTGRPHYHACLFGIDFEDKYLWEVNKHGDELYRSPLLEKLWPYGYSRVGALTFQSAAYTARYIMKKITGAPAAHHYTHTCPDTGLVSDRVPEYTTMSRKPGIAAWWINKFRTDVYPSDQVMIKNRKGSYVPMQPPRFYDGRFEAIDPDGHLAVKRRRIKDGKRYEDSPERLAVREKVRKLRTATLERNL